MKMAKLLVYFLLFGLFLCPHTLLAKQERGVMPGLVNAVQLYSQGEYKKAAVVFSKLLQKDSENDAIYYYLAMCNMAEYKLSAAENLMAKAVSLDSSNVYYRHRLAQIYAISKKYEQSLVEYEKVIAAKPKDRYVLDELAEVYLKSKNYAKYWQIAKGYMVGDELDEESKLLYLTGVLKEHTADEGRAMRPYLDSLFISFDKAHPQSSVPMKKWCQILMYLKDWKSLDENATAAISRFPQDTLFYSYASTAKYFREDFDGAAEILLKEIDFYHQDVERQMALYNWLGEIYFKSGKKQKCFTIYEKALKQDPDNIPILNNYAYFLSLTNRNLKKALDMSHKTIVAEPDNPTYLDTYGWILYLMGRLEEALAQFNHAKLYGGNDHAVILDHFATVLYDLGEYRLAFTYWDKAVMKNTEGEVEGLEEKIAAKKAEVEKRKDAQKAKSRKNENSK